jgi:hypothetical protein
LPRWPQAAGKGVDPLGYYLAPWAYADLQVVGEAVEQTKSLDQDKIADYIRSHTFETVVGDVAFGEKGEWKKARVLTIQFQGIAGTSVDDFRDGKGEVVLWPDEYKAGEAILPYSEVKHRIDRVRLHARGASFETAASQPPQDEKFFSCHPRLALILIHVLCAVR